MNLAERAFKFLWHNFKLTMRANLIALLLFILSINLGKAIHAEIKIEVIYPKEGSQVIAAESTFIFGNVSPVDVDFMINGETTRIYPNGSFLAYVPVDVGNFSFTCQAAANGDTTIAVRNVYIPYYLKTSSPDLLVIDTSYVFPKEDWELQPGDVFKVAVKGTPGYNASFSIEGLAENLPMHEISSKRSYYWGEAIFGQGISSKMSGVKGIYTGSYMIKSGDRAINRKILFQLTDKAGNVVKSFAPGKLNIDNAVLPRIAEITEHVTIAQNNSHLGSQVFLPTGTMVWITGQRGNYLRAQLSEMDEIWINSANTVMLPLGTHLPAGNLAAIRTEEFDKKARVNFVLDQRLPFKVEQIAKRSALLVTFYGMKEIADQLPIGLNDPLVEEIRWEQKRWSVYQFRIELNQDQQWGYDPYFENRNLYIDIKKKPKINSLSHSPLKDIIICLDPGHGFETGAIGPRGFTEKDMNYKYCVALKDKLEKKGAFVVLTRGENDGATLKARTQLAVFMEADILLSLHFNALPDGVDPMKNHGISTYYYQPQSAHLAYFIQKMLLKKTKVKNFGLFYDNLTICRTTQMISVLTEPGFIMHPWEEILIASESYRNKVVDAIVNAIEKFLEESK